MHIGWAGLGLVLVSTWSVPAEVQAKTPQALPAAMTAFGPENTSLQLLTSNPIRYQRAYHQALAYVKKAVAKNGRVMNSPNNPATLAVTGEVLSALALNQASGTSTLVAHWLWTQQNRDGGFGRYHGTPSDLTDTAYALLGLEQSAYLSAPQGFSPEEPAIARACSFLLKLATPQGGLRASLSSPVIPALSDAAAARALIIAGTVGTRLGWPNARAWLQAGNAASHALNSDNGIEVSTTSDLIAAPLMGLNPSVTGGQRQVASLFTLGFAYPGFGAKAGSGYLSGMDWIEAKATFNLVVAAANVGLKATALSQYNAGLFLQNPDGGFGLSAHPSVGPETGTYSRGPGPSRAGVTAQFLIATNILLNDHILAASGTKVTWRSPSGNVLSSYQPAGLIDPTISMNPQSSPRVAVLVPSTLTAAEADAITSDSPEVDLDLNPAYVLTRLGFSVQLFWVKPDQAGVFYPLSDLWPNLSRFQVLVLPAGTLTRDSGFKPAVGSAMGKIADFVKHGGRLLALGETSGISLTPSLKSPPKKANAPMTALALAKALAGSGSLAWLAHPRPIAESPAFYQLPNARLQVLARARIAKSWLPVIEGTRFGKGRIIVTTLPVAGPEQDQLSVFSTLMNWLDYRLNVTLPTMGSDQAISQSLLSTLRRDYYVPQTHLFREQNRPSHRVSYLWPFSQTLAGIESLARTDSREWAWLPKLFSGLQAYFNPKLTPPAYIPYLASQGGTAPYYDDDGWTGLDLMNLYQMTGRRQDLTQAEVTFTFLTSGWNHRALPAGGEYFDIAHKVRTQTATGAFLTLALRLYLATGEHDYLSWAQRIETWDTTYFQGPNGIYWDSMDAKGQVKGVPLPSDTGIMLQADVLWYRLTHSKEDLLRAENLADAALTVFVDPLNQQMQDDAVGSSAAFNVMLVEGLAMLYHFDPNPVYRQVILAQAQTAYRYDRSPDGIYGDNWNGLNNPARPVGVLTEGATLNLFGIVLSLRSPG